MSTSIADAKIIVDHIRKNLINAEIVDVTPPDEGDEGFYSIIVKTREGEKVSIEPSIDPEGNGPGFLFFDTWGPAK